MSCVTYQILKYAGVLLSFYVTLGAKLSTTGIQLLKSLFSHL